LRAAGLMFPRRRRKALSRALSRSQDPELVELYDLLAERRERVAALELELFEARSQLAAFQAEAEARLGPLLSRLEDLETDVRAARHQAALRAQWGDKATSGKIPYDVLEQFNRTWRRSSTAESAPPKQPVPEPDREEIKRLYRSLAKRFHPDLTTDAAEKKYRESLMAKVNEAYAAGNLAALKELSQQPDRPEEEVERSRDQEIADLRAEIRRLDGVVLNVRSTLDELTRSHDVQLMLEATMARREGRDLIGEMVFELKREIAALETELAELR
jgi:hypothetical protein